MTEVFGSELLTLAEQRFAAMAALAIERRAWTAGGPIAPYLAAVSALSAIEMRYKAALTETHAATLRAWADRHGVVFEELSTLDDVPTLDDEDAKASMLVVVIAWALLVAIVGALVLAYYAGRWLGVW